MSDGLHSVNDSPSLRRILCIDGGGIMGVQPASFLSALEEGLNHPIAECFDLIAGTSTGGILAIGLALGIPAKQLLDLYVRRGPTIFGQDGNSALWRLKNLLRNMRQTVAPKHDADVLRNELLAVLGDKKIGEARTRLLIPAWDADTRRVHLFKTAHHKRLKTDYKRLAIDAAMSTASAPTFFKRHRTAEGIGLVDGGIWANNPIALATVEAITLLGWPAESLRILSLGCVEEVYALSEAPGIAGMAFDAVRLFMDGQSHGAMGMVKLLTGHEYEREAIFRCCPAVPKDLFKLDDTRKIDRLKGIGAAMARKERIKIEPVFLSSKAEAFRPVYELKEIAT